MRQTKKCARRWVARFMFTLASAGALLLAASTRAQEKVGLVLEVKGFWSLDSSPASRLGGAAALPAGGVIRLRAASGVGASYIVVGNTSGDVIERRECNSPENCQPVVLPKAAGGSSRGFHSWLWEISYRLRGKPDVYKAATSRGAGGEMQEALVLMSAGKVDLSPPFAKMSAGKYLLRMKPLEDENQAALGPFEFEWNPAGPQSPIEMKGVGNGLYHLSILDAVDGQPLGGGMDAWVLICGPESYPKLSSDFSEVSERTAAWGSKVSKATVRSFLRAYLDELAERK